MSLVDEFLFDCEARGLSNRTVGTYRQHLQRFVGCVEDIGQVNQFTAILLKQGISKFTIASYQRSIKALLAWVEREKNIPTTKIRVIKLPRRIVHILSREEIQKMEDIAVCERDKLIVRVLADTGIRLSGMLGMKRESIVELSGRHYLRVIEKGDKERSIPLTPKLAGRLKDFCSQGRVFLSRRYPYLPLNKRGAQKVINDLGVKIGRPVHPHLFRHSFITYQLRKGMNPILLAKIVGHEDLSMIMRVYSHLQAEDGYDSMMENLI